MDEDRVPMANIPPFGLRMQPDLKARVEEAARANNRSLNAEIVNRIEEYDELSKYNNKLDNAYRQKQHDHALLNARVNALQAERDAAVEEVKALREAYEYLKTLQMEYKTVDVRLTWIEDQLHDLNKKMDR